MPSRSPLLVLILALVFISLGPWVEAIRYELADVTNEAREDESSLQRVPDSEIVVLFHVIDNTPEDSRFKKEIGYDHARQLLNDADFFVLELLNQIPIQRGYLGGTLTVESFGGYETMNSPLKVSSTAGNHIRLNSDYIDKFRGDVMFEFDGIMYHELTRVWLWDGQGSAPNWLLSGIADYVRLKSGHPSKDWPRRQSGLSWTDGYAVTAYFFQYLSQIRERFIVELNAMMETSYSDEYFVKLFGKSVDKLWEDYEGPHAASIAPTPAQAPAP